MDGIGKQIGGNHYLKMGKQPVELAGELNLEEWKEKLGTKCICIIP